MIEAISKKELTRSYWPSSMTRRAVALIAGFSAVFIAIKVLNSDLGSSVTLADHFSRLMVFCALTVWVALSIGIERRGAAAMIVLAFMTFTDLFFVPVSGQPMGTVVSSNLGIVLAYAGLQLYWFQLRDQAE